eukprot:ANDGO_02021.mRNA.1 Casein kinase I isoform delta-like
MSSSSGRRKQIESTCIGGAFLVGKKIGSGSFGDVYQGFNLLANRSPVAIKVENARSRNPKLRHEARILKQLQDTGIAPKVYYYGLHLDTYYVMVTDLLGSNLEELFDQCGKRFSVKTVCMIGIQLFHVLEMIHSRGLIHRDVKPENFLMGITDCTHRVFAIDFGLAKKFIVDGQHIPYRSDKRGLTGTARYASVKTHWGIEQSRRDDLESLCYLLVYFLQGKLPWQGLRVVAKEEKFVRIAEMKGSLSSSELCQGLPKEFTQLLDYVRGLSFDVDPEYEFCRSLLSTALFSSGTSCDFVYDWTGSASAVETMTQYSHGSSTTPAVKLSEVLHSSSCHNAFGKRDRSAAFDGNDDAFAKMDAKRQPRPVVAACPLATPDNSLQGLSHANMCAFLSVVPRMGYPWSVFPAPLPPAMPHCAIPPSMFPPSPIFFLHPLLTPYIFPSATPQLHNFFQAPLPSVTAESSVPLSLPVYYQSSMAANKH